MFTVSNGEDALTELLRVRGDALRSYAGALCQESAEASDLLQEVLISVLGRLRLPGTAIDNLEAYIKTSMAKRYIDDGQRKMRWRRFLEKSQESDLTVEDISFQVVPAADIDTALSVLSASQRVATLRYYFDDQPISEIAREMHCSEGNVKRHLSDARKRLAVALSNYAENEVCCSEFKSVGERVHSGLCSHVGVSRTYR